MTQNHSQLTQQEPQIIASPDALDALAARLLQEPRVALDTESNSLHAYNEQVCLIQISIPGTNYLIDPLALDDLSVLAPMFATDTIEKVFHAADYDLLVLNRDFDFHCVSLFDTMWAARILGWPRVGLANILETYFHVHANKRFQRYNWGQRPIEAEALRYAWMDSHFLLDLREIQKEQLVAQGRWAEAQEIFDYLCEHALHPRHHSLAEYFWRVKGIHDLSRYEQKVLYQLYLWREDMAQRLERPTVKVISNNRLMTLARAQPHNRAELYDAGLTHHQIRRFGQGILKALCDKALPTPPRPEMQERPSVKVSERYHTLKAWRRDVAAQRRVDSDVILPNAVLWSLAKNPPADLAALLQVSGIGPWRQQAYGPDILRLV